MVLEKTLESPLDSTGIQPVHPKGDQSWIFIGSTDTEADAKLIQYFSHLMQRTESLEKTLMMGKIEVRRKRGRQRMRWLNGITESMDMSLGDGQGGLACCSPWGRKELHMTEWTELSYIFCLWCHSLYLPAYPFIAYYSWFYLFPFNICTSLFKWPSILTIFLSFHLLFSLDDFHYSTFQIADMLFCVSLFLIASTFLFWYCVLYIF